MLQSFPREAYEAWEFFCRVTLREKDPKTGVYHYSIQWPAVSTLVSSYSIFGDVREAVEAIELFIEGLTGAPMIEEQIFGWE